MAKSSPKKLTEKIQGLCEQLEKDGLQGLSFSLKRSIMAQTHPVSIQEKLPQFAEQITRCRKGTAIDVSGLATTQADGKVTWRLREYIETCDSFIVAIDHPFSFVATPHSETPVYITTRPDQGPLVPPGDVSVEVFTWDQTGLPAPGVSFSWRCHVPVVLEINAPAQAS